MTHTAFLKTGGWWWLLPSVGCVSSVETQIWVNLIFRYELKWETGFVSCTVRDLIHYTQGFGEELKKSAWIMKKAFDQLLSCCVCHWSHTLERSQNGSCRLDLHRCVWIWRLKSRVLQSWAGGLGPWETHCPCSRGSLVAEKARDLVIFICLQNKVIFCSFLHQSDHWSHWMWACVLGKILLCCSLQLVQWMEIIWVNSTESASLGEVSLEPGCFWYSEVGSKESSPISRVGSIFESSSSEGARGLWLQKGL